MNNLSQQSARRGLLWFSLSGGTLRGQTDVFKKSFICWCFLERINKKLMYIKRVEAVGVDLLLSVALSEKGQSLADLKENLQVWTLTGPFWCTDMLWSDPRGFIFFFFKQDGIIVVDIFTRFYRYTGNRDVPIQLHPFSHPPASWSQLEKKQRVSVEEDHHHKGRLHQIFLVFDPFFEWKCKIWRRKKLNALKFGFPPAGAMPCG